MDVQAYRDHPRLMMDLEEEDVPDALLDRWMSEGFQRIIRRAQRWQHLEVREVISTVAAVDSYTLSTVERPRAIHGPRGELQWMEEASARQAFWNVTTAAPASWPKVWSEWADGIIVWPSPDAAYDLTVIGYREASTAWIGVAGEEPDLPAKFHDVLLNWVMFRCYQQQDDIENAQMEKASFEEAVGILMGDDMSMPVSTAGLVLNGGNKPLVPNLNARLPYEFE